MTPRTSQEGPSATKRRSEANPTDHEPVEEQSGCPVDKTVFAVDRAKPLSYGVSVAPSGSASKPTTEQEDL